MPETIRHTSHPLVELTRARLLEFVRTPSAIFWTFGFPVLLAVVLGIAFRGDTGQTARVAVTGPGAAALLARLPADHGLELVVRDEAAARHLLRTGRVDVTVAVPAGGALLFRFDATRPGALAARRHFEELVQRAAGRRDVVEVIEERVVETGGRYIDFLIPGLIGLNIMGSCMWGMGYSIVDARRRKLLKRYAVTPMNRGHFLSSFVLSRLVFLVAEVVALVLFGHFAFDVAVSGSLFALAAVTLAGALAFSGLSLLIASRTDSTEVASGWMNFVQLPMWLLGGAFFDYSRFPEALHPLIRALPLTALNDGVRLVMGDGAGLVGVLPQLAVLLAWGVATCLVALRVFRWQ